MSRHHSTDFLTQAQHRHPAKSWPFWARVIGWTTVFVLVVSVPFLYSGGRMVMAANAGRVNLEDARAAAEALDFATASASAAAAHDSFLEARDRVDALRFTKVLPVAAGLHETADAILTSGIAASDAAAQVFRVADEVLAVLRVSRGGADGLALPEPAQLFRDLTTEEKRGLLAAIAADADRLKSASESLVAAEQALDSVPSDGAAAPFAATILPLRKQLADAKAALGVAAPFADVLPALLGYPDERNYLFFFENNDELRPGGGFLGVYGAMTIKDAGITDLKTDDVYALDGPSETTKRVAAPVPLQKYIGVKQWYLRDANWSPDFPTSARLMAQFYREEAAVIAGHDIPAVDGIIAITPDFAEDLMRLIGSVTVDGITFDAANLIETLQYEVEQGFAAKGVPYDQRKDIVGRLVEAVTAKVMALSVSQLLGAAGIVERNLEEGHIMIYSADETIQTALEARDWAGKMKPVQGDYVSWIDANLAALKSDAVIERSLKYTIVPSGDGYEGRIAMTYKNTGTFTWKTTRYRTYARVFLPGATEFLAVEGAMENDKIKDPARRPGSADGYDLLGRRAYGAFISIEPGETRTLEFRVRLAPQVVQDIRDGKYQLDVEKQLGTEAIGLTLDLDFGKKLTSAAPSEARKDLGDGRYRLDTDLRIDRVFEISF